MTACVLQIPDFIAQKGIYIPRSNALLVTAFPRALPRVQPRWPSRSETLCASSRSDSVTPVSAAIGNTRAPAWVQGKARRSPGGAQRRPFNSTCRRPSSGRACVADAQFFFNETRGRSTVVSASVHLGLRQVVEGTPRRLSSIFLECE